MVKQGLSKKLLGPDDEVARTSKNAPQSWWFGDAKKDNLKNSIGMTNEEKEKLVQREKGMSRNRAVCMSEIQVPGPGAYKP